MPRARIYAILDADACDARGLPLLAVGQALCRAAPDLLQLRAKGRPAQEVLEWLAPLRRWTREHGSQLYMNDRADLAELAGCDGVHVGQMDQPIASVRLHFPRLRVGVSTHSEEEFNRALGERPDYLALGPIFGTASKRASEPTVGLVELARLAPRARALSVPVVAIGGIDLARAPLVAAHAEYAAAIAALLPELASPDRASPDRASPDRASPDQASSDQASPDQVTLASLSDAVFERTCAYAAALRG